ncbi:MAG: phage tail tube protein [Promethearchaeota archaeon]
MVWIGEVLENSIDDSENKIISRYMGTSTRSIDSVARGPRNVTGVITYNAQDFRLPFLAIGSVYDISGTQSYHGVTQINGDVQQNPFVSGALNPPFSFTIEDSKQAPGVGRNFIRTINGCVLDSVSIKATQGEKVEIEANYIGQTLTLSSGTTSSVTENTRNPYLWNSASLTLSGSLINTAKEITLEINNNMEAPHYLNLSRDISVPFPQNRDYILNVTIDLDSDDANFLYNSFYKGNSRFNGVLDFNQDGKNNGSQHAVFELNRCHIMSMDNPSTSEGLTETTMEIRVENITGSEWTSEATNSIFNPY